MSAHVFYIGRVFPNPLSDQSSTDLCTMMVMAQIKNTPLRVIQTATTITACYVNSLSSAPLAQGM